MDKVVYCGASANTMANPTGQGQSLKVRAYVCAHIDRKKRHPLLVFVHGGVHSNFSTGSEHIIKELIAQGYIIISTDYRGSTGYGEQFYKFIDYGGLEAEDVYEGRNFMVENELLVDPDRIGSWVERRTHHSYEHLQPSRCL